VTVAIPVVALLLSASFEGLRWQASLVLGILLCLAGNVAVLYGKGTREARRHPSELLRFRRFLQRQGRAQAAGDHLGDVVEVGRADLALVPGGEYPCASAANSACCRSE